MNFGMWNEASGTELKAEPSAVVLSPKNAGSSKGRLDPFMFPDSEEFSARISEHKRFGDGISASWVLLSNFP